MQFFHSRLGRSFAALSIAAMMLAADAPAQNSPQTPPPYNASSVQDGEEVIRVSSEIVQTDVTVLDKQGKFVDGLRPEDFELKVDGKEQQIVFFERVRAGSVDEDAQLRAARGGLNSTLLPSSSNSSNAVRPLDRGRSFFFFFDDMHLAADSLLRARSTLMRFIEEEMGQNDEAAIVSASGQIGFLQQLTGDRAVLRAALERLRYRSYAVTDNENPRMTEAHAFAIEQNDIGVTDYFTQQLLRDTPFLSPDTARQMIRQRASGIMKQSENVSRQTLLTLESFVRGARTLPGRKVVFFISDGFFINAQTGDTRDHLRRLTDAAARAGVVIYTLDSRGLSTGSANASESSNFDHYGQLAGVNLNEIKLSQEPLRALAEDTGGRAILNTNALGPVLSKTMEEASVYYILAWKPEDVDARNAKFRRIEARLKERPELRVQARRGYYISPPAAPASPRADGKKSDEASKRPASPANPQTLLTQAITAAYPTSSLPIWLALAHLNVSNDSTLLISCLELDDTQLAFRETNGKKSALVDIAGVIYDSNGKVMTGMKQELQITPNEAASSSSSENQNRLVQCYQFNLPKGLYQTRFAARDRATSRIGSSWQWIEIPDPTRKAFSLSSLFVSERIPTENYLPTAGGSILQGVNFTADRRFSRASYLRFLTFIYNAARTPSAPPDVVLQIQIFRDDQPVLTAPLRKVDLEGVTDADRIPYAAEIPLEGFPVGSYVLQVTAIDRASKNLSTQRVNFSIE